ncbi:uncharacterized protein Z518_07203 [Rhinocladiella mackenziei CBS 650.93]|uniref:Homeobox domain-containing protein n=1 Tax=Rhinocladiella mackenziei CBS 650.93 TaxID=1442369 RepID=A0A0D2J3T3_9EURO|nr:uncharacterized protein Z518_07203 [Rhinocladiella mackenziei CBS 650.93]KIX03650.1 hypothetical protein Z518_07203 [Rhinocladiella mackenziei CBS 650.93]
MEHYSQTTTRPYASNNTPVASQTRLDVTQPEQQLPSIREVIPPPRANTLESNVQGIPSTTRTMMVPYLSSQPTTSMNVASIPAPVQPQTSPMAFPADAASQIQVNGLGSSHQLQTPTRTPAEYSSPWSSSSSFTDAAVSMNTQPALSTQSQSFAGMSQPMIPSDTPDYASTYSLGRQVPTGNDSPDSFSRWRTPQVGSTQRYNPYLMSERSYNPSLDYGRYGQSFDQYRSPLGYDGGYRSLDTSPYHMKYSQLLSYPIMGYSSHANGRRRRGNLPKPITDILRRWLQEHLDHPYPTDEQKQIFIQRTGLTISQISNWFINARRRQLPALKLKRAKALQSRA